MPVQPTLDQGPGKMSIARIVAHEWQTDGYLKPGTIKRVRRLDDRGVYVSLARIIAPTFSEGMKA